jgi:hypothetical protein
MGMNKAAIKIHPFQYLRVPAGRNKNRQTNSREEPALVMTCLIIRYLLNYLD